MDDRSPAPVNDRLVPLEAGFNLRDFGGYACEGGGQVRRGMLYRSGTMALLTPADAAHLRTLGIRAICDFRRGNERANEPTDWHGPDVDYYCRDYSETSGVLGAMIRKENATVEDVRQAMIALYHDIPVDHAQSYRAMFAQMLDGRLPILINCSAGKDRTGVGAALILAVLGVPRETIVADYLATNAHADWAWRLGDNAVARGREARAITPVMEPLLGADAAYLDNLFVTLDAEHGGIENYLNGIGVDAAARAALRAALVTP